MDYSTMSLVELKKHAKTLRVKQYYIMKRSQLIELLQMDEVPEAMRIEKLTIHQLRAEAKKRGIVGFWNLRRGQIVEVLYPTNETREE